MAQDQLRVAGELRPFRGGRATACAAVLYRVALESALGAEARACLARRGVTPAKRINSRQAAPG